MIDVVPILKIHIAATAFMTLVIWFVQLIKYPQLNRIPMPDFSASHKHYMKMTGYVLGPVMAIELLSGTLLSMLFIEQNNPVIHLNMGLLMLIWISTFAIQVPCHSILSKGYNAAVHKRLVRTNWIRTIAWSLRLVLLANFLIKGLGTL